MAGSYKVGDPVIVQTLKKEGTIVEVLKDGEYKVGIGSFAIVCKEKNLKPMPADQWKRFSHMSKPKYSGPTVKAPTGGGHMRVDLHGLRYEEAMVALEKSLNDAILANCDRFEICHGVGMGVLLTGVHKHLKGLSVVKRFQLDEHNPGVTWVYF